MAHSAKQERPRNDGNLRFVLKRIIPLIDPENAGSRRMAEKLGLRLEREIVRPGNALRQMYMMVFDIA